MAGLACGLHLQKAGVNFTILEASDGVGGRVRTDVVDGFLLDRGFQIFLTSYQEAQAVLDYPALDLKPFYAGKECHHSCVSWDSQCKGLPDDHQTACLLALAWNDRVANPPWRPSCCRSHTPGCYARHVR